MFRYFIRKIRQRNIFQIILHLKCRFVFQSSGDHRAKGGQWSYKGRAMVVQREGNGRTKEGSDGRGTRLIPSQSSLRWNLSNDNG